MSRVTNLGKYQIVEPLDESGPIAVYTARGPLLDRLVVIQLCRSRDQALRDRFSHRAERAGRLQHRNVVATLDFGIDHAGPYLVEELLSGEDLAEKIGRPEPVSVGRRLGWLRQVALGLDHAHRQEVVHGAVGPRTVRVLGNDRVKVRGFGVGWLHGGEPGARPDRRADLRAFGALAFALLARRPPAATAGDPATGEAVPAEPAALAEALFGCPEELVALVERCLDRDPTARYSGFSEVIVDLTPVLTRERAADRASARTARPAPPPPPPPEVDPWSLPQAPAPPPNDDSVPAAATAATAATRDQPPAARRSLEDTRPIPLPPPAPGGASEDTLSGLRARQEAESTRLTAPPPPERGRAASARVRRAGAAARPGRRWGSRELRWVGVGAAGLLAAAVLGWGLTRQAPARPDGGAGGAVGLAEADGGASPAAAAGTLVIDAAPWAEVTRVVDEADVEQDLPADRSTPLVLLLVPGRYRVELTGPAGGPVRSCEAVVSGSEVARCRVELARVSADDFFRETGWWR